MSKTKLSLGRAAFVFGILLAAAIASAGPVTPVERKLYVGKNSQEATLTFEGKVQMESASKPSVKAAGAQVQRQVEHLFGTMGENRSGKAVPKTDHIIANVDIEPAGEGQWEIGYTFKGTIVVENRDGDTYDIVLPTDPTKVFEAGMVGRKNPCTDPHYQTEGDFWYFWNPESYGCPLKEGIDYQVFTGKLDRTPNTKRTYPEYARLLNEKKQVLISVLMGMNHETTEADPNTSTDLNAENFRAIKKKLLAEGWKPSGKWSPARLSEVIPRKIKVKPHIEGFTKEVRSKRHGIVTLGLRIFFGPTGIEESSAAFHHFLDDALKNHSIMIYAGHSGLGGHLSLEGIEQATNISLTPDPEKYQIYFFNSCSSYPYYGKQYFDRKGGTKNLDIVTNGLATYFSVLPGTILGLIEAVDAYFSGKAKVSYQALADDLDSGNLFGVNGDEDNPKR